MNNMIKIEVQRALQKNVSNDILFVVKMYTQWKLDRIPGLIGTRIGDVLREEK